MAKGKSPYDIHEGPDEYVKAFGKRSKNLDRAFMHLSGRGTKDNPGLDAAHKKLAGHEKHNTPQLDEAYRHLAGRRRHS